VQLATAAVSGPLEFLRSALPHVAERHGRQALSLLFLSAIPGWVGGKLIFISTIERLQTDNEDDQGSLAKCYRCDRLTCDMYC
jgi:hypothetical protein